jgi:hypothetical protein
MKKYSLTSSDRAVRSLLNTIFLLVWILSFTAQAGAPPLSSKQVVLPLAAVQQVALPPTDIAKELAADAKVAKPAPLRIAIAVPLELTPANSGTWEQLPEGRLWRLRIVSTNATDLNFGFTKFWLPEGATLHVSAEGDSFFQGPYTAEDNQADGQLWTAVVPGEAAVIELFVPTQAQQAPQLVLTQVGTGYRDFAHKWKDLGTPKAEGTCNNDVICPVGDPWRNEIRSVGVYTVGGVWTCTGTMVMDAPHDFRPFFLTANHCELSSANAGSVVVYWNYQSATCGTHGPGSLAQNQSGATFRAAKTDVDFALIELNSTPSASFQVYYAGWDASGATPPGCVGIHHPDCDVKAISFCTVPLTTINSCIGSGGVNSHWYVHWSSGVTEPGSSGSGIWDSSTHLLVGTLSGGNSACGGSDLTDCYGKFSISWASGSSSADRLKDWLDPLNTGVTSVAGSDSMPVAVVTSAGTALVAEGCPPGNGAVDPGEVVTVNFSLKDTGTAPTTNLVATLQATNGVTPVTVSQSYGALAAGGAAVAKSFTFMATGTCGGTISPTFQLQDGPSHLGTVTFSLTLGTLTAGAAFTQNFDGVTAPTLPAGWTASGTLLWTTTAALSDTSPNSAFVSEPSSIADNLLVSPLFYCSSAGAQLTFRHYYATESGYDGCVLEISINGGAFTDIVSAGGSFLSGGYSGTISSSYSNPLGGRSAWTGSSGGFLTTTVALPSTAAGKSVQFRWRLGSDTSISGTGWHVDTISSSYIAQTTFSCCTSVPRPVLSAARYNSTNHWFQFTVAGATGYPCEVLLSTNLQTPMSNWVSLITNTAPFIFIDFNWPVSRPHFYRVQAK